MAEQRHTGNLGNIAADRDKASRSGQAGGQHGSGNFADDRERAAEAGRKDGEHSHGGAEYNPGNSAQDRRPPGVRAGWPASTAANVDRPGCAQGRATPRG